MDYTTPDYTFTPNPRIYTPNDLPPSPRMKTVCLGKSEPGVWPEEYKHLDKGKPLIQELIDLEIHKHLGDDGWTSAGRRQDENIVFSRKSPASPNIRNLK